MIILVSIGFTCLKVEAQKADTSYYRNAAYEKFRFGGYGEVLFQRMDYGADRYSDPTGAQPENRAFISVPRAVFTFDYKFRPDILFSAELEIENGGTGSALELEYEESGEYEMEMEKAGEVVLEQFHFTKVFHPAFSVRVGHMVIPVGQCNMRHESILYFGTIRPESENAIIPMTWHETGISVLGYYGPWSYQLFLVNGLDANGFSSAYWVKEGHQGLFEDIKITDPAFAYRVENKSIKNLRLSASGYIGNSTGNTTKPEKMDHLNGRVTILSGDLEYAGSKLIARANIIYGDLSDSYEISAINKNISKNIQYQRTPVAQNALAYGGELGYQFNIGPKDSRIIPFARYEYYNSMENTAGDMLADARFKRDVVTVGVNYFVNSDIALKADYSHRRIDSGNYNSENTMGLALVYTGWFSKK